MRFFSCSRTCKHARRVRALANALQSVALDVESLGAQEGHEVLLGSRVYGQKTGETTNPPSKWTFWK